MPLRLHHYILQILERDLEESLIGMVELLLKHASTRDMISLMNEVLSDVLHTFEVLNKPKLIKASISYLF